MMLSLISLIFAAPRYFFATDADVDADAAFFFDSCAAACR